MPGFTHPGIKIVVRPHGVTLRADNDALYEWAHRPGAAWPCSNLQDLGSLEAHFDAHGLVDTTADIPADEFNAFTSDALAAVLTPEHPAHYVTVGQFS